MSALLLHFPPLCSSFAALLQLVRSFAALLQLFRLGRGACACSVTAALDRSTTVAAAPLQLFCSSVTALCSSFAALWAVTTVQQKCYTLLVIVFYFVLAVRRSFQCSLAAPTAPTQQRQCPRTELLWPRPRSSSPVPPAASGSRWSDS